MARRTGVILGVRIVVRLHDELDANQVECHGGSGEIGDVSPPDDPDSDALVSCRWIGCPPYPYPYVEWITDDRLPHGDSGREGGIWLYVNNGDVAEVGDAVFVD